MAVVLLPFLLRGFVQEFYVVRLGLSDKPTYERLLYEGRVPPTNKTAVPFNSLCYSIAYLRVGRMAIAQNVDLSRRILKAGVAAIDSTGNAGLHIIVVIGETHVKRHCALYGYGLPDQPWQTSQREQGRLLNFNNAVSCATSTTPAIVNSLCLNHLGEDETYSESAFWPTIFKAAGWQVTICDHQVALPENTVNFIDLADILFPSALRDSLYDHYIAGGCDFDVDSFPKFAGDGGRSSLALYHLMGQHYDYLERYPAAYARFSGGDVDDAGRPWMDEAKRQKEAEYANATLYNDHVLSKIAATVDSLDAVLVYYGDHGEEIYDYRDCQGRVMAEPGRERENLLCLANVPLVVWWTPLFDQKHPEMVEALREAVDKPIYTPLIGHTILHLAGISGWGSDERRNFMSTTYQTPKRIVNDRMDYDAIVGSAGQAEKR